eukprot:241541-Amphidinium_carterae.1
MSRPVYQSSHSLMDSRIGSQYGGNQYDALLGAVKQSGQFDNFAPGLNTGAHNFTLRDSFLSNGVLQGVHPPQENLCYERWCA